MLVSRAGASLPGHRSRTRAALTEQCLGLWDLTGGSAERCIRSLINARRLVVVGSPVFTKMGVLCDAANYLRTGIAGGESQLTYAIVAQRTPASVYVGNLNTSGESDTLLESSDGDTRTRFWNGAAVNLDVDAATPHPAAVGEFFFAATSFGSSSNLFVARNLREAEVSSGTSGRTHVATDEIYVGRGNATAFTDETVLISMLGVWSDSLNSNEKAEQYHVFRQTVEQNGVFC